MGLRKILEQLSQGEIDVEQSMEQLSGIAELGFARIDHHRVDRCGIPEVVYAKSKTSRQCVDICREMLESTGSAFFTRVDESVSQALLEFYPEAKYDSLAQTVLAGKKLQKDRAEKYPVVVCCAGTSDLPVAREALNTLDYFGFSSNLLADVGVAGLNRLLLNIDLLQEAAVIIVAAGMEGALPSVVGGLVKCPVIAVPTSVGYGAAFSGAAALLGMLNSCAGGVGVMNIDNGFGAACLTARIINKILEATDE